MSTIASDIWYGSTGPRDAQIMIVGESWGAEENRTKRAFQGQSGQELNRIMRDAGFDREQCFCTNVVPVQPVNNDMDTLFGAAGTQPEKWGLFPTPVVVQGLANLQAQVAAVRPRVIVAFGNYALWALTGRCSFSKRAKKDGGMTIPTGIMNWRGSQLTAREEFGSVPVVPTIHPAVILRDWAVRPFVVHDVRARVGRALAGDWAQPEWRRRSLTTRHQIVEFFNYEFRALEDAAPVIRACDIETRRGNITCIGIGMSKHEAVCIPLVQKMENGDIDSFWSPAEEVELLTLLRRYFLHPRLQLIGQNFLYDMQYLSRWLCLPRIRCTYDTMLMQHLLYPGMPKSLHMMASLYCHHYVFWKEESQEWDGAGTLEQLLQYNCTDLLRTYEVWEELCKMLEKAGMWPLYTDYMRPLQASLLRMMRRGVRICMRTRKEMTLSMIEAASARESWLLSLIPQDVIDTKSKVTWPNSSYQQKDLFFDYFGLKCSKNRKTKNVSVNEEAINELKTRYPMWKRLFDTLLELRSIGVFHNTFLSAGIDPDGRWRSNFNPGGTETFRLSSSKNAFYRGGNLQNIPAGGEL